MKRWIAALLCLAMAASFAACSPKEKDPSQGEGGSPSQGESTAQIPNPMRQYETLEEAQEAVDFTIPLLPGLPEVAALSGVAVIDGKMVQLTYQDGEQQLTYRSAKSDLGKDISGDYTDYPVTEEVTVDGRAITLKGDTKSISLAIWQEGELSFSLSAAPGLPREEMEPLLANS